MSALAARSSEQVLDEMLALSPPGDAMPRTPETMWAQMLAPTAGEVALIEAQAARFEDEIDPGAASYLLPDYERVLGPDPYGRDKALLTVAERQALALSRWVDKYGVRPADFVKLAADLGVTITIREYRLGHAGAMQCGDQCVNHPTEFAWLVTLPSVTVAYGEAGVLQAGQAISAFGASLVAGAIADRAPAHTTPFFSYTG